MGLPNQVAISRRVRFRCTLASKNTLLSLSYGSDTTVCVLKLLN